MAVERALLRLWAPLLWIACELVLAAEPAYQVEIDAPPPFGDQLKAGLSLIRWQDDPEMTPELLDRLVDEAVGEASDALGAEGYFAPAITHRIDRGRKPPVVILQLRPGERTVVREVALRFAGPVVQDPAAQPLLAEIRKAWTLGPGQGFRQQAWDEAKTAAVERLAAWRYAAARVAHSAARIDPATHAAVLEVEIDSGPAFRFGDIEVSGLRRYPERVVRNLSPVLRGAPYEREVLLKFQNRLLATGYFISARVEPARDPAQAEAAPVQVALAEGPSRHVEAGLAYNTDTGFRTDLRYKNNNWRDQAWRLSSDVRIGGAEQHVRLGVDLPPLPDASWLGGFVRLQESDVRNERVREAAIGASRNWGLVDSPSGIELSFNADEQRGGGPQILHRHASFLSYRRGFRAVDDPLAPRAGQYGNWSVGIGLPGLSSRNFLRATGQLSWLHPLGKRDDLLLRGELGVVFSESRRAIPASFLFRTGGDQSVRGYAFQSLGVAEGDATVGGRYLAVASVEYTHWLNERWGVAGFVDVGDAWDQRADLHLARGTGIGARFRTPIGPLRADLAYGQRTHETRLHFSVGFSF